VRTCHRRGDASAGGRVRLIGRTRGHRGALAKVARTSREAGDDSTGPGSPPDLVPIAMEVFDDLVRPEPDGTAAEDVALTQRISSTCRSERMITERARGNVNVRSGTESWLRARGPSRLRI